MFNDIQRELNTIYLLFPEDRATRIKLNTPVRGVEVIFWHNYWGYLTTNMHPLRYYSKEELKNMAGQIKSGQCTIYKS